MTPLELDEWLRHCPTLYHMAERGSWPSIQQHGLLSTSALLDLFGEPEPRRHAIERVPRNKCEPLRHPSHGRAMVRDQKPMREAALRRCLQDGMTVEEWCQLLNGRVFFWPTRARLLKLLGAKSYRRAEHDVLELDAASLVQAHEASIMLSPINSGSPYGPNPAPRGPATFQPIAAFDCTARSRKPLADRVVELTVARGLDVRPFVERVTAMRGSTELATLWERRFEPTA